jgi:hypothetical protein
VLAGLFVPYMLGGLVAAELAYAICFLLIAVWRCEGDRPTRRAQATTVALAGAAAGVVIIALGVLASRALGLDAFLVWGLALTPAPPHDSRSAVATEAIWSSTGSWSASRMSLTSP